MICFRLSDLYWHELDQSSLSVELYIYLWKTQQTPKALYTGELVPQQRRLIHVPMVYNQITGGFYWMAFYDF